MEMGLSSYQKKKIAGNKTECQHNAICCYVNGTKAIRFHNVFMTIFEFLNEAEQQDSSTMIIQGSHSQDSGNSRNHLYDHQFLSIPPEQRSQENVRMQDRRRMAIDQLAIEQIASPTEFRDLITLTPPNNSPIRGQ